MDHGNTGFLTSPATTDVSISGNGFAAGRAIHPLAGIKTTGASAEHWSTDPAHSHQLERAESASQDTLGPEQYAVYGSRDAADLQTRPKEDAGIGFLRECIALATDCLSRKNQREAYNILDMLESQTRRHDSIAPNGGRDVADRNADVRAKVLSVEGRMQSLEAYLRTEAEARASMSALYNHEFGRVGIDMAVTKRNHEELSAKLEQLGTMPAQAEVERDVVVDVEIGELQAMLETAVKQEISTVQLVNNAAIEGQMAGLQAELCEEKAKREKLDMLVHEKLQGVSETLQARSATLNVLETSVNDALKVADRLDAMKDIPGDVDGLDDRLYRLEGRIIGLESRSSPCEHLQCSPAINDIEDRLAALERPADGSVHSQLQELRMRDIDLDCESERMHARIVKVEEDLMIGLHDERLTAIEVHLQGLKTGNTSPAEDASLDGVNDKFQERVTVSTFDVAMKKHKYRLAKLELGYKRCQYSDARMIRLEEQLKSLDAKHDTFAKDIRTGSLPAETAGLVTTAAHPNVPAAPVAAPTSLQRSPRVHVRGGRGDCAAAVRS